ncbi:glycosyltransferase family 4 protein [Candidatus Sumerlaeota bacterium]|nr:glycosyltransferase family 4 protein [Candidatus Sumerlaeota bacterium]
MVTVARPVALDARMISHSGIGSYIRGLLEGLREIAPGFSLTLLGDPATLASWLPDVARCRIVPFRSPVYGLREQLMFPAQKVRGALLHCPHYNIALRHKGPLIVTIHDLIHLHEQWGLRSTTGRSYARFMLQAATRRAIHILADSAATADELATKLNVEHDRISVVYPAPAAAFYRTRTEHGRVTDFCKEHGLPPEYLLTVGLYKPHKNLNIVFDALKALWAGGITALPLVMAGMQMKEQKLVRERLEKLAISDRVIVLNWLEADKMPLLYRGARLLVHPSLAEGFGLPIVEAQAVGTPVVASRIAAATEVAGNGAAFFDPRDAADLADRIAEVIHRELFRIRLVAAGRRNAERFSWRQSAEKALEIYQRVAAS